jgi:hypothetical protein
MSEQDIVEEVDSTRTVTLLDGTQVNVKGLTTRGVVLAISEIQKAMKETSAFRGALRQMGQAVATSDVDVGIDFAVTALPVIATSAPSLFAGSVKGHDVEWMLELELHDFMKIVEAIWQLTDWESVIAVFSNLTLSFKSIWKGNEQEAPEQKEQKEQIPVKPPERRF